MGHKAKWEYFRAVYERYHQAGREAKRVMLNEFCLNTGYHRKYAIRLLNGPPPGKQPERRRRGRRPRYGPHVLSILAAIWEAAGYPWSVRLKALLPNWMPWIRQRYRMTPPMEKQLLGISARQIDRRLQAKKSERKRRIYGRTKPGSLLKHHIPVKTDSWDVTSPGFSEVDLVAHCGNSGDGEFAHTLNLTDIHSGWTESGAFLGKSQVVVQQGLDEIERGLPFRLLGVDSDNGSEFINWHLKGWCEQKQIQLTRGRPYKKDDNAHVEQKNWTHVRQCFGYERHDNPELVEPMNALVKGAYGQLLNYFHASLKLDHKERKGGKVRRIYKAAQTPLARVLASAEVSEATKQRLRQHKSRLNPFALKQAVTRSLKAISAIRRHRD